MGKYSFRTKKTSLLQSSKTEIKVLQRRSFYKQKVFLYASKYSFSATVRFLEPIFFAS